MPDETDPPPCLFSPQQKKKKERKKERKILQRLFSLILVPLFRLATESSGFSPGEAETSPESPTIALLLWFLIF